MIRSYQEYKQYLLEDYKRTGILRTSIWRRPIDKRFKFYRSLRLTEWLTNSYPTGVLNLVGKIFRLRHQLLCDKYNWTIPVNVFGPGLAIVHRGTIVVNGGARIGKNCRIHVDTNIGAAWDRDGKSGAPIIGDNVYIAPGVKIFGPVVIGDNTAIGANSVVNSSVGKDGNCTIAGVPAKIISQNTSGKYIIF